MIYFDPSFNTVDIENLPILDRWMLNRTAQVVEEVSIAFENYEFSRFFANFCEFSSNL